MTDIEWRFAHGVGPEPHDLQGAPPVQPDPRDRTFDIPDEDIVFVTDTAKTGLDTWDF